MRIGMLCTLAADCELTRESGIRGPHRVSAAIAATHVGSVLATVRCGERGDESIDKMGYIIE
jgi:hypothetical protein